MLKNMITRLTVVAMGTGFAIVSLTGCGGNAAAKEPKTPVTQPVVTPSEQPPTVSDDVLTVIVDGVWDSTAESERDDLCMGIDLFGLEWTAEQMQTGATDKSIIVDWDKAAQLVAQKCDQR
jgi:hypothetical protein